MKVVSHEVILDEIPNANTLHSATICCKIDNDGEPFFRDMYVSAGGVFLHSTDNQYAEEMAIKQAKLRCFNGSYDDFLAACGSEDCLFYQMMYCAEQYVLGLEV